MLVNLDPLIQQIKEFNQHQLRTHQLLTTQNQLLTEIRSILLALPSKDNEIKELLHKKQIICLILKI